MFLLPRPHDILMPHHFSHYYDVISLLSSFIRYAHAQYVQLPLIFLSCISSLYSREADRHDHYQLHDILPVAENDDCFMENFASVSIIDNVG